MTDDALAITKPSAEHRLLIAGGGTGGHLFPGVAIAEELRARFPGAAVRFVGTARGIEARVLPDLGWDLTLIEVSGLKTVGLLGAAKGLLRLPRALWQARRIVRGFAPTAVIGVGGYASGPVVLMARLAGLPTAICEQNSIPGLTNKILGKLVRAIFLSFAESKRFFAADKIVMSGNPVRRQLAAALLSDGAKKPEPAEPAEPAAPDAAGAGADAAVASAAPSAPASASESSALSRPVVQPLCVLVCGGSLGAVKVNQLAAEALTELSKKRPLRIVHQTGATGYDDTVAFYRASDVPAECSAFIKDMASVYRQADLIISRAGATTVAELAIAAKPAIFIPYPFAADNHQEINAKEMADAGAALSYRQADLTAEKLAAAIEPLLDDPAARARMSAAMKSLAKPAAAATVVDWCVAAAET
jgi:UDP-N-acetylglucosamine--N-acetylmuramyl-(pentapeptide) pyrophosphoryl-undecaprenol N-acetylglucosamine transferase